MNVNVLSKSQKEQFSLKYVIQVSQLLLFFLTRQTMSVMIPAQQAIEQQTPTTHQTISHIAAWQTDFSWQFFDTQQPLQQSPPWSHGNILPLLVGMQTPPSRVISSVARNSNFSSNVISFGSVSVSIEAYVVKKRMANVMRAEINFIFWYFLILIGRIF